MNDAHRAVLLKHGPEIVRDLIVNDSLLGALYHWGVFSQEMVDIIRTCQLPSDKVYKLLELIQKCGPDAFDNFVEVLEESYQWLAKLLRDSAVETEQTQSQNQATLSEVQTPRATSCHIHLDSDIKARVSGFVQKQFGNMRKISMADKKQIERWVGEWLQAERKRLTDVFDQATSNVFENPQIKERLWFMYKQACDKRKKPVKKRQITSPTTDIQENNNQDMEAQVPETPAVLDVYDMTFDLMEEELNEILERMLYLEKQVNKSYQLMGFPKTHEKDISAEVQNLCEEFRHKERELTDEKKKIESMLLELYDYSTSTNRMQFHINSQEHQIRSLEEQIVDIEQENCGLHEEIKALERQALIHLEKEHTLTELRKAKEDLQTMLTSVNKQNEELKKSLNNKATAGRFYQNRKSITQISGNNANKTVQPVKAAVQKRNPVPKKRSNSFRT